MQLFLVIRRVLSTAASAGAYRLQDRALHVYQEAALVPRFRAVCNDAALSADAKLVELASLMDASHASCRCGLPGFGTGLRVVSTVRRHLPASRASSQTGART